MASSPRTPKTAAGGGGGPATPHSFRKTTPSAASPTPRSTSSPAVPTLLPRNAETQYHRRLRSLLLDHRAARDAWVDVVSFEGARTAKEISQAWSDVEKAYPLTLRKSDSASTHLNEPNEEQDALRDKPAQDLRGGVLDPCLDSERDVAIALIKLETLRPDVDDVRYKLQKHVTRLVQLSTQAKALLLEASSAKGLEFAFRDGMWGTWTLERFADALAALTSQHVLSTSHLFLLLESLQTSSPLSPSNRTKADTSTPRALRAALAAASAQRQQALEQWLRLPFLADEEAAQGTGIGDGGADAHGARYFDAVCAVEVGRWEEGS